MSGSAFQKQDMTIYKTFEAIHHKLLQGLPLFRLIITPTVRKVVCLTHRVSLCALRRASREINPQNKRKHLEKQAIQFHFHVVRVFSRLCCADNHEASSPSQCGRDQCSAIPLLRCYLESPVIAFTFITMAL